MLEKMITGQTGNAYTVSEFLSTIFCIIVIIMFAAGIFCAATGISFQ